MNLEGLKGLLKENNIAFVENESMKDHTTFKIGGNADLMVNIKKKEELSLAISFAKQMEVPYFLLGRGSNLLVSDEGISGAVINTCGMDKIEISGNKIVCDAGVSLSKLCVEAANNGLSGLEFAYGIPGTVGGALYMNAGAYGGEVSQIVVSAECVDESGNTFVIKKDDMALGYRTSVFKGKGIVISRVSFELGFGDKKEINAKMNGFLSARKEKQPLEYPSAGSTFKRPQGNFAGALIEKNDLKGVSVGGAMVSTKHAGFIVNFNNAKAKDVLALMELVKERVKSGDNIELEPEVIFVGRNI